MTTTAASQITKDRLRLWQKRNEREQLPCTPFLLINVMHGEKSGDLVINTVETVTDNDVMVLLRKAVQTLEAQITNGN